MITLKNSIAVLFSTLIAMSCNDNSFKSKVVAEPPAEAMTPTTNAVDEAHSVNETPVAVVVDDAGSLTDTIKVSLKVDVVFAIDTSASMDDELISTQNNLSKMITTLNNGKVDSRIHLMLDQPLTVPAGTDPNKVAFIQQLVDSTDAISRLTALFSGLYNTSYRTIANAPMATPMPFRKDAKLEVVVITDDNGEGAGNLAIDFDSAKTLKATFNGIIGLPTTVASDTCSLETVGSEYITLAQQSMGSTLDICSPDWSALITRLSNDMVKRSVTFPLTKKPKDPASIIARIGSTKLASADWSYDAKANTLLLLKTDLVKDGSVLTMNYSPAN